MQEDRYRKWLKNKIENKPISDYISRCARVELSLHLDLDAEYRKDKGKDILYRLSYSKQDERENAIPKCNIKFENGASIYNGLSSLRTAVKKYFDFCNEDSKC